MGIFDFVRSGVRELMIARSDADKHLIVSKHPNNNIPMYSQLTVDVDECAVFFKSGSPPTVAMLPPGRHHGPAGASTVGVRFRDGVQYVVVHQRCVLLVPGGIFAGPEECLLVIRAKGISNTFASVGFIFIVVKK